MRVWLISVFVVWTLLPLAGIVGQPALADNISVVVDRFANGEQELVVEFLGGGVDSSNALALQTGLLVDEVRLNVSSVSQPSGSKAYPTNVMVDFGGDRRPEWAWIGPGYGPLGRQTMFVNNKPYMNASVRMGGGYNDSVAIRLPKSALVKSATMNVSAGTSIGQQGKVLVMPAVYDSYGWADDPVNKLKAFTSDFSVVDKFDARYNTPTWDDVKDYSAILVYSDGYYGYGFSDANGLGDLLADYVDAGGSVVCAMWAFYGYSPYQIGGRFQSEDYYVIPPSTSLTTSGSGVGTIAIANHPVMANVSSISFPYWGYTYRMYGSSVTSGSTVVSYWGDGYVMAAYKSVGGVDRVDINMWPVSYDASGMYGSYQTISYYGDGDDLIKNALLFGGRKPVDARVDILNDSTAELDRTGFTGNYTFPDFAAELNDYIASANVTFVDDWGNRFVDVPINVSSPAGGRLSFGNLDITYDYTTVVDANPYEGNLTSSVADLQSSIVGEEDYSIPMYVSASSSGKVRLSGLYVRATPPRHAPRIDSYFPALKTVVNEGTTLDFGVNATDIYGNPVSYAWSHNGDPVPGATGTRMSLDLGFEDAGNHTVTVKVSNPISEKTFTDLTWNIVVKNVNRAPEITAYVPMADPELNESGELQFSVEASDPDEGDELAFAWFLDGKPLEGATTETFTYAPGFQDSGPHSLKVVVTDREGAHDSRTWQVRVLDVNVPPVIAEWTPKYDPRILEKESMTFGVTATDIDRGDILVVSWFLNGEQTFVGNPFTYVSDYRSAGEHTVRAEVTDGDAVVSHEWALTVVNVNRLPQATIDTPKEMTEFLEGQTIRLSGASSSDPDDEELSFSWKEGGVNVSDQMEFERPFPPGLHTLTLEVRDLSGGVSTASVRFRVRFVEISVAIGVDRLEVVAGNKVTLVVTMTNIGDTNATDVPVELSVDGKSLGTLTIADFRPGGVEKAAFEWKATKGPHTLTATVGGESWTKEITVEAAPPPPPGLSIEDYAWPIVLVVMIAALLGFGMMVLKKK